MSPIKALPYYVHAIPSLCCYCSEAEKKSCFPDVNDSFDLTGFHICPAVAPKDEMDFSFQKKLPKGKKMGYSVCGMWLTDNLEKEWNLSMLIDATEKNTEGQSVGLKG